MKFTDPKLNFSRSLIIWIIVVGLVPPLFKIIHLLVLGSSLADLPKQLRGDFPDIFFSIFISAVLFISNTSIYNFSSKLLPKPEQQLKRILIYIPISLISSNLLALTLHFIYFPQSKSPEIIFQIVLFITIITLVVSLILIAFNLINMWKHSIIEKELLEKAHVRTQLESLRTQIN
ncbi:MAG: hypothetical protein ACK4IY_07765, partial [Chitinophagales bacterium]